MASTKSYYDQLMDNQAKLFKTMAGFTNAWMEMMTPSSEVSDKAGELMNDYYTKTSEMMEAMASKEKMEAYQKDFWATFTADYTKNMEVSMELYKKSAAYFKDMWSGNMMESTQERTRKLSELYQHSMKTFYDTTKANGEVMQEYMSAN
ncbi:MAG: hypothetical protein RIC19_06755 [Phaeodactylibacter sp.]|uniref:hypothetical protein n=1 Tax=Phaeodactylibacter sp. TaxID=1940289 RepID=UPI0032EC6013